MEVVKWTTCQQAWWKVISARLSPLWNNVITNCLSVHNWLHLWLRFIDCSQINRHAAPSESLQWRHLTVMAPEIADNSADINRLCWLRTKKITHLAGPGPCITNVIATCRKNFSQWESSFLWKLRCHWLKFLRRVAKTLVIQGPVIHLRPVDYPHKRTNNAKLFPSHDVIMTPNVLILILYTLSMSGFGMRACTYSSDKCKNNTTIRRVVCKFDRL